MNNDSRVADVDPWVDLMEVFGRPVVKAGVVRQQIIELLKSHLEARHVESVRNRCVHLLVAFSLHTRRSDVGRAPPPGTRRRREATSVADRCRFTALEITEGGFSSSVAAALRAPQWKITPQAGPVCAVGGP